MKDNRMEFYANIGNIMNHDREKAINNPKSNTVECNSKINEGFYFIERIDREDFLMIQTDESGKYLIMGHDFRFVGNKEDADRFIKEYKSEN